MKIDNSGPSFTFDANTTQAIEEGKNRITLLQIEELRLSKLKGTLEAELIRMENDLSVKTDSFAVKTEEMDNLEVSIFDATSQLNATNKLFADIKADIEVRTKAIIDREEFCRIKEKDLEDLEKELLEAKNNLTKAQSNIDTEKDEVSAKLLKIEDFLRTL